MKLNRNKVLAMLASFVILTTVIGVGVWSLGSPSTIIITPQSLADAYSYTIFTDGVTTYLKNGSSGQIVYSGTNSTLAEEYAIGNLTVGSGGSVLLKEIAHDTGLTFADNIFLTVELEGVLDYWIGGNQIFHVEAGVVVVTGTLEATNIYMDGSLDFNDQMATKMKFWSGVSFPLSPVAGQPYYRTDLKTLYVYDGAAWSNAGTGTLDSSASYSYLVFINGTTTYMKNGTTGRIDYSSTNASRVFFNAYGNLSVLGGGSVYVKQATYTLTNWISPCENSTTVGEGWSTILRLGTGADTNLIRFTGVQANNIVIRDLALDGNMAGQSAPSWRDMRSGIYSGNYSAYQVGTVTNNLRLYNLYIHDVYCGAGIRIVMSDNIVIQDVKAENNGVSSTYMSDAVFVGNSTNVKITNLEATNCLDTAIALCNVQHSTVVGTRAINCGAGIAIVNEYPTTGVNASLLCNYNTIVGGFVQNCSWGNVGVNVNSYTAPPELPDHTTITGMHLLNNTYNVLNLGEHTILTGCTLGMSAPILVGTKDVWIRDGTMSITGCTINDADVGIETVYTTYQLEVSGNTFNPATLTHILNLTGSVTDLDIHGNNGFTYPSDQIGSASFIVSTDGTTYYATNCTGGQVLCSSTNASAVINNAIGNASAVKGSVFIKAGDYPVGPCVSANFNNTLISGEGIGTHLYIPNNQPNLTGFDSNHMLFWLNNCENVTIENICFDGNFLNNLNVTVAQSLILVENCRYVAIQNNFVINGRTSGISLKAFSGENTYGCKILNNVVRDTQWNAIEVVSYEGLTHDCSIVGNTVTGFCDIGIAAPGYSTLSEDISVIGNSIFSNGTGYGSGSPNAAYGIKMEDAYRCLISGNTVSECNRGYADTNGGFNIITGNTFQMNTTNAWNGIEISTENNTITSNFIYVGYTAFQSGINLQKGGNLVENNFVFNENASIGMGGITETNNPDNNVIRNNKILGFATSESLAMLLGSGVGRIVSGNIGFVTENSGSVVNATATAFTITHGLAGTPNFVSCSFNSTQIDGWAWTSTSSTITVTVHNRVTTDQIVACYWEAKYVP